MENDCIASMELMVTYCGDTFAVAVEHIREDASNTGGVAPSIVIDDIDPADTTNLALTVLKQEREYRESKTEQTTCKWPGFDTGIKLGRVRLQATNPVLPNCPRIKQPTKKPR